MNLNTESLTQFLLSWNNDTQAAHESYMRMWSLHMWTSTLIQLNVQFNNNTIISEVLSMYDQKSYLFAHTINGLPEAHATSFAILTLRNLSALNQLISPELTFAALQDLSTIQGFKSDNFIEEVDSRLTLFTIIALEALCTQFNFVLDDKIVENCTNFLISCINDDGGAGAVPNAISHAAQVYCVVCGLKILNTFSRLSEAQISGFSIFLLQLQTSLGGFCGRQNKLPDACYCMWAAATLKVLGVRFNEDILYSFVTECQDQSGGIADRQGNPPDLFHSHYVCSFLGQMGVLGKKVDAVRDMVVE
ncbi:Geranylgeranyltransferase type-2 subunit beta [Spironucleus salmonicida]|uniref:Geranylgeranyl transferase type II subunit beta n=1 Tax=Spironucleus salmonicida TaxID=348837 RepID=V6LJ00_9EUKA|nr:Geranylgeranyltransferase type-2 subunit beta [Spironucleus salmonicida]|eukprot:EST44590.1 Prenyltransferase and squalene oxidase repeat protein [Spironucleus salmonicida]